MVVAHTGQTGLAMLARTATALLLLDLQLPDTHGNVVMEEIRKLECPPEIIIVTGHADLASAGQALDVGAGGYITKPVDLRSGRIGARCSAKT